jgi:protein arginine N-methyltransferase 2
MDDPAFSTPEVDINTQTVLLHASNHDLAALKPLLRIPGNASVQDPETGFTPLHAAIAACGHAPSTDTSADTKRKHAANGTTEDNGDTDEEEVDLEKAKQTVRELFLSGAIWNDLDTNGETPGCLAWRLGRKELYELCVEAGVRAEMLLGLMGGYEPLAGEDSEDEELETADEVAENGAEEAGTNGNETRKEGGEHEVQAEEKLDVNSADYLASTLRFTDTKLLDSDANGVMMAWETSIMRKTVDLLIPSVTPGSRILNIGFGMGIIDRFFRDTKPLNHHIIEAHPAVLQKLSEPDSDFDKVWEESAPEGGKYVVHAGKWQDVVPKLLEEGEVFDVIYFDTFGEDYSELKFFFSEYVVGLLDPAGRFGFLNGLGADRRVCYDVYCRVVELDLCEAGMDVDFTDVEVEELAGSQEEGKGEWEGVRRRYFAVDRYRLPICTFMG